MDKNIQIYEIQPRDLRDNPWQRTLLENAVQHRDEPCHVTCSGETFYTGHEGGTPVKKRRRRLFRRLLRRKKEKGSELAFE